MEDAQSRLSMLTLQPRSDSDSDSPDLDAASSRLSRLTLDGGRPQRLKRKRTSLFPNRTNETSLFPNRTNETIEITTTEMEDGTNETIEITTPEMEDGSLEELRKGIEECMHLHPHIQVRGLTCQYLAQAMNKQQRPISGLA